MELFVHWPYIYPTRSYSSSHKIEFQSPSSPALTSCIVTQSPPYKVEMIKKQTTHHTPIKKQKKKQAKKGMEERTYLNIHRQMGFRPNFLLPLPPLLILRPIGRGTRIRRLSVGCKRDGGEVLEEPNEEERHFVVSELKSG